MTWIPIICIVDDAIDYCYLLQHQFNREFPAYSVAGFAGGKAFLEALSRMDPLPSLILLDRHMPDLDGHQTLLRLKGHQAYKKIPVVMMSAEASVLEISGCYEAGANSFLRKPMGFNSLSSQVRLIGQYWIEHNLQPLELH